MPIGSSLAGLFGRSPIKPLQEHMRKAHQCVELLVPFIEALNVADWNRAHDLQQRVSALESEADELKREIRRRLPKSLFLNFPREDLLDLLASQDKVANTAEDIVGLMYGRRMVLPPEITEPMMEFVRASVATSSQAVKAIGELDELIESGFGGHEIKLVEKLIEDLDQFEQGSDDKQVVIRERLYAIEKELHPVDVMFLYRIIEEVGELADRAQRVGGQLQMLLAR